MVEDPGTHLLARCPSSEEQLFYSDARLDDVKTLSLPIKTKNDNIELTDILRFFKGNGEYRVG